MYTPGPWEITDESRASPHGEVSIMYNLNSVEGALGSLDLGSALRSDRKLIETQQANANLIATAPELLIALEDLFEFCKNELQESPMVYLEVESAIAKAKGIK